MRYTGEQWDTDTGLLYLRARWYDPSVGRFTTRDPFPGFAALPQTLHPYTYCQNNPVNLTDPSGKIPLFVLPLIVTLPLLVGGVAFVADWVIQVLDNMCYRDMSFWEAVHHGNINWSEAAGVGVTAAGGTVMVLGGVQMVLVGGTLLLWQVGVWAQSPTAMTWGNTVSNWVAQYSTWLWMGGTSAGQAISQVTNGGYIRVVPTDQVGTSQPFKTRPGEDGLSVFEGVSPEEILAEFPGRRVPNTTVTIPTQGLPSGTQVISTQNPDLPQRLSDAHRILVRPEGWSVERFARFIKALVGWE